MPKKLMVIINPATGRGSGIASLGSVLNILHKGGYLPTVYFTDGVGDATKFVREHGSEYDCVVTIGGDGTLSETAAGLAQLENPPLLGYIPRGTTNDMAITLKLPRTPREAARTVIYGTPTPLDLGLFNGSDYFTYIAAFGAFTDVSYETAPEVKHTLGHLAYILTGMTRLASITGYPVTVEYDGGIIREDLVFGCVSNSSSVAGIVKLPNDKVDLSDGIFEVILIKNPANILEFNAIISSILSQNYSGDKVMMLKSRKVKFSFDEHIKWTRDGESGGAHREVILENIPSPIKIMT